MGVATTYLLKYGYSQRDTRYFNYYDTLILTIDGINYEGIVLDSCGACMRNDIIDLFVSNSSSAITTYITVK